MCYRPILVKNSQIVTGYSYSVVPCGKCIECAKSKQNDFASRVFRESSNHKYMYLVTLTYNNDKVPFVRYDKSTESYQFTEQRVFNDRREAIEDVERGLYPSLRDRDLVGSIKRAREAWRYTHEGQRCNIKYSFIGEYGSKTGRPHYHGIVFGFDSELSVRAFFSDWCRNFGNVDIQKVTHYSTRYAGDNFAKVAKYVSKYVSKGYMAEYDDSFMEAAGNRFYYYSNKGIIEKPHRCTSQEFGIKCTNDIDKEKAFWYCYDLVGEYDIDTFIRPDGTVLTIKEQTTVVENIIKDRLCFFLQDQKFKMPTALKRAVFCIKDKKVLKEYYKKCKCEIHEIEIDDELITVENSYEKKQRIEMVYRPSRLWSLVTKYIQHQHSEVLYGKLRELGYADYMEVPEQVRQRIWKDIYSDMQDRENACIENLRHQYRGIDSARD